MYVDSDAVVFDLMFPTLPRDVQFPCVASTCESCGMHSTGCCCVYPSALHDDPDVPRQTTVAEF
eukprot:1033836-Karenia_brevis.AAC.1